MQNDFIWPMAFCLPCNVQLLRAVCPQWVSNLTTNLQWLQPDLLSQSRPIQVWKWASDVTTNLQWLQPELLSQSRPIEVWKCHWFLDPKYSGTSCQVVQCSNFGCFQQAMSLHRHALSGGSAAQGRHAQTLLVCSGQLLWCSWKSDQF